MKLKEIFKIENILTNRKTPCDIEDFLNEEYYSESGNTFIPIGHNITTRGKDVSLFKNELSQDS